MLENGNRNPVMRAIDFTSLEHRISAMHDKPDFSKYNPCAEIKLTRPELYNIGLSTRAIKKMNNPLMEKQPMKISRPVLVSGINVLEATESQLAQIIRNAKEEIEMNKDLAELSVTYKNKKAELEEIITLCVSQLDKNVSILK